MTDTAAKRLIDTVISELNDRSLLNGVGDDLHQEIAEAIIDVVRKHDLTSPPSSTLTDETTAKTSITESDKVEVKTSPTPSMRWICGRRSG
jgi:hypothetical protein